MSHACLETEKLPPNTYVIMVHKKYSDRVVDYVLQPRDEHGRGWINCSSSSPPPFKKKSFFSLVGNSTDFPISAPGQNAQVQVLDSNMQTGLSHDRRGYYWIKATNTTCSMQRIPAMARQFISFVGLLQESCQWTYSSKSAERTEFFNRHLGPSLWKTCREQGFSPTHGCLRIDCQSQADLEPLCMALQIACAADTALSDEQLAPVTDDPFEGPIPMTMSRNKCSHRLTIIVSKKRSTEASKDDDSGEFCFHWGVEQRRDVVDEHCCITNTFALPLNQEAQTELATQSCDCKTGEERPGESPLSKKKKLDPSVPLSRAYYKLDQIWNEELKPFQLSNGKLLAESLQSGAGMDLGASPGGWTQVLALQVHLKLCVAVDPAKLATRIAQVPCVYHANQNFESTDFDSILQDGKIPGYSMLVCDASQTYASLLEMLPKHVLSKTKWQLPVVFVITMKLPFKTLGSIQKHVDTLHEILAQTLLEMVPVMFPGASRDAQAAIQPSFRLVHAMANSESERTLIAVFQDIGSCDQS